MASVPASVWFQQRTPSQVIGHLPWCWCTPPAVRKNMRNAFDHSLSAVYQLFLVRETGRSNMWQLSRSSKARLAKSHTAFCSFMWTNWSWNVIRVNGQFFRVSCLSRRWNVEDGSGSLLYPYSDETGTSITYRTWVDWDYTSAPLLPANESVLGSASQILFPPSLIRLPVFACLPCHSSPFPSSETHESMCKKGETNVRSNHSIEVPGESQQETLVNISVWILVSRDTDSLSIKIYEEILFLGGKFRHSRDGITLRLIKPTQIGVRCCVFKWF